LARTYWPNQNPIGRCVKLGEAAAACGEVIGVVRNRRTTLSDQLGAAEVFVPLGSSLMPTAIADPFPGREVAVRVNGNPSRATLELQSLLLEALPTLTSVRIRTAQEYVEVFFRPWRLGADVLAAFALLALALASVGVFGVSSHLLAQRTRELGVRSALGATPAKLRALIILDSLIVACAGLLIGVSGAIAAALATRSLVFGISPLDPRVYVIASGTLVLATLAGTLRPALRAGSTDPAVALRCA